MVQPEYIKSFVEFIKSMPEIDKIDKESCGFNWNLILYVKQENIPIVRRKLEQWRGEHV